MVNFLWALLSNINWKNFGRRADDTIAEASEEEKADVMF